MFLQLEICILHNYIWDCKTNDGLRIQYWILSQHTETSKYIRRCKFWVSIWKPWIHWNRSENTISQILNRTCAKIICSIEINISEIFRLMGKINKNSSINTVTTFTYYGIKSKSNEIQYWMWTQICLLFLFCRLIHLFICKDEW